MDRSNLPFVVELTQQPEGEICCNECRNKAVVSYLIKRDKKSYCENCRYDEVEYRQDDEVFLFYPDEWDLWKLVSSKKKVLLEDAKEKIETERFNNLVERLMYKGLIAKSGVFLKVLETKK